VLVVVRDLGAIPLLHFYAFSFLRPLSQLFFSPPRRGARRCPCSLHKEGVVCAGPPPFPLSTSGFCVHPVSPSSLFGIDSYDVLGVGVGLPNSARSCVPLLSKCFTVETSFLRTARLSCWFAEWLYHEGCPCFLTPL